MEIVLLSAVIVLCILQVLQLFKNCTTTDDIRLLQDNVKHLTALNKVVYKDMIEEYSKLTKALYNTPHDTFVYFRNMETDNENIYYHELPEKLEELKKLKARLCDKKCDSGLMYAPNPDYLTKSIQELFEPVSNEELEKHLGKKELKKIRKQRKKK